MTQESIVKRVRDVLLAHGEPISASTLARGMGVPVKVVTNSLKMLESQNKAQKGMKGWRAL